MVHDSFSGWFSGWVSTPHLSVAPLVTILLAWPWWSMIISHSGYHFTGESSWWMDAMPRNGVPELIMKDGSTPFLRLHPISNNGNNGAYFEVAPNSWCLNVLEVNVHGTLFTFLFLSFSTIFVFTSWFKSFLLHYWSVLSNLGRTLALCSDTMAIIIPTNAKIPAVLTMA